MVMGEKNKLKNLDKHITKYGFNSPSRNVMVGSGSIVSRYNKIHNYNLDDLLKEEFVFVKQDFHHFEYILFGDFFNTSNENNVTYLKVDNCEMEHIKSKLENVVDYKRDFKGNDCPKILKDTLALTLVGLPIGFALGTIGNQMIGFETLDNIGFITIGASFAFGLMQGISSTINKYKWIQNRYSEVENESEEIQERLVKTSILRNLEILQKEVKDLSLVYKTNLGETSLLEVIRNNI